MGKKWQTLEWAPQATKYSEFRITRHARERGAERFNITVDEIQAVLDGTVAFDEYDVRTEQATRQRRLCADRGLVVIVDLDNKTVPSVYITGANK